MRRIFLSSLFRGICASGMVTETTRTSRANRSTGILPVWRAGVLACARSCSTRLHSAGETPAGPPSRDAVLRHCCHALSVQPDFADAFDPRENVIHGLATEAHQFLADDAAYEIIGRIENLLWRRAVEALAKNGRHRASERLHFRAEGHANVGFAHFIDVQINADGVGALLVFANIDEVKSLALTRLLPFRIVCIRNQRLTSLIFRQRFKKIDDLA